MQAGDIITAFNGTKIATVTDLLVAIRASKPGQQVTVGVQRGKTTKTVTVTLTGRPSQ